MQLAFLSRSHVLKETSNHCRTDSGSGERWKACDSRIISAHDRIFSWFNRYIELIWPLHEKGIAGAEHPNPGVSNRCSFLFSGVKSPYPIDTVESWPTLSKTPKGRSEDHGQGEGGQIEHWKLWEKWKVNMGRGVYVDMVILRQIWEIWTSEAFDVDFLLWGFILNGFLSCSCFRYFEDQDRPEVLELKVVFFGTRRWTQISWRR